jgi:hypothetical protein
MDAARVSASRQPPPGAAGFDRDDIFGLRRAMAGLPESPRDSLMRRWALIGARCEYDVSLVHADVRQEAEECDDPWLAQAWLTIEEAIKNYLAWKRQSLPSDRSRTRSPRQS